MSFPSFIHLITASRTNQPTERKATATNGFRTMAQKSSIRAL